MPTYGPPKKNTQYIFYMGLPSQANPLIMQVNPTLAAGDFKVATGDGAPANLGTLPVVDADFTKRIKVTLSIPEMNGDNVTLIASDAAGSEWCDVLVNIPTVTNQFDDMATEAKQDTLLTRIVGTLLAGNHNPQTGDGYAIVNNGTYGNAQLVRATTPANDLNVSATGTINVDDKTGFSLSSAGILAIWNQLTSALTTVNTIGKLLVDNINAAISSRSSHSAADVWTVVTRALTDKAGFSLAATGLNLITSTQAGVVAIAKAVWDRVITSAFHNIQNSAGRYLRAIIQFGGYEGGKVWLDTVNGTPGTEDYESGTKQQPVDTEADALTIAVSVGLFKFEIAGGSTLLLTQAFVNYVMEGHGWVLDLNGQDISGTHFSEAIVSGIGTGTTQAHFHHCDMQSCTLPPSYTHDGVIEGTVTLGSAGQYYFQNNISDGDFILDFAAIGNNSVDMGHTGDVEVRNMGQNGTDTLDICGCGQLTIAASCVPGGTINISGDINVIDNGTATVNVTSQTVIPADGSIKAATFDQATAFPVTAADTGATGLARAGADGDTLETISDEIANVEADIAALNDISVAQIIAGISEGSLDLQEMLRTLLAFAAGEVTGGGTTTINFWSQDGSKKRIIMTVDEFGNRSIVVVDGS